MGLLSRIGRGGSALAAAAAATVCSAQLISPDGPGAEPARTEINRPLAARRLVHEFTFDDPEPFAVPRYWSLAQDGSRLGDPRPGYPKWNDAELQRETSFRGGGAVRLTSRGGSVCLRLEPGVIPVFPDAEYLVSAHVKTRGLERARAALTARYLDKTNAPIKASESRSELVRTGDAWAGVVAPLLNGFEEAAYIQIDLQVLQPEQYESRELGRHQVWEQDFGGEAWFDSVAVVQLPRVRIGTGTETNVIERPSRPRVEVSIRDLTGEPMEGELIVQDARGRVIDRSTRTIESGVSGWEWTPALTDLGWYRARLELRSGTGRVGATHVDFAWVEPEAHTGGPHGPPDGDAERFGVLLTHLPVRHRLLAPEMVRLCGAGSVSIPVWNETLRAEQVAALAHDLVPMVDRLKSDWRRISFVLPRIPDELASLTHVEPGHPLALFSEDEKLWGPYLDPLLDRFGQGVQRWQVGVLGEAPRPGAPLGEPLGRLHHSLSRLVPGPLVALPWPGDLQPPSEQTGDPRVEFMALVPHTMPAEGLGELSSSWVAGAGSSATLVLEPLPEDQFSRFDSAVEVVKSAVAVWAGEGGRGHVWGRGAKPRAMQVALVQPWDWPGPGRDQLMPRAELGAYRNLLQRLSGRQAVGMLPSPGVTCYILAPSPEAPPGRGGALVAWQDRAALEPPTLRACLGGGSLTLYDIFGNARMIEPGRAGSEDGAREQGGQLTHLIPISDEPVFIEGVDVDLARFAASFALEPSRLPPTAAEHDLTVVLSNPWSVPVAGRITVLEPGGLSEDLSQRDRSWRITPRTATFSISPGQAARIPLVVAFSAVEEAGAKDFVTQVELAGTRDYGPIRLRTTLEVGLESTPLDLTYQVNGEDLLLEAQVTNRGRAPATFEISAFAPGHPRQKASISELEPGVSATRRFSLPGGAAALRGQRVTVGLQDLESRARVNRSILIE